MSGASPEPGFASGRSSAAEVGRLRWRCRRGMRELDAILARFLAQRFDALSAAERSAFEVVLDLPDPVLHAYLLGRTRPEDPHVDQVIAAIRGCAEASP